MIEFDRVKSDRNLRERGFGFNYAARIFRGDVLEWIDDRQDYGEVRIIAIGAVGPDILTVVYTWRGNRRRIISARRASKGERNVYHQNIT